MSAPIKALFILDPKYKDDPNPENRGDGSYRARLEGTLEGNKASVFWGKVETKGELDIVCQRHKLDALVTTRADVLKLFEGKDAKLADYYGSILHTPAGREVLIIPPLKWLVRVSYGEWYIKRMLSKIYAPHTWPVASGFTYKVLERHDDFVEFRKHFDDAWLCSIDIETRKPNIIRTISYTLKFHDNSTRTGCFRMDSMDKVEWMRTYNSHPIAKVMQNGKYECAHFFAYSAPCVNWIADTLNAMHSTWSELPKDLSFVSSLFNRTHIFWKDLGEQGGWENLLHYNALDTWQTCEAFCAWLKEAPDWAMKNYTKKFPQNYLSHEMEMRGLKRDSTRKRRLHRSVSGRVDRMKHKLETMTATPGFNANSYKQVRSLGYALTGKMQNESDDKALKKLMQLHPLNERIFGAILDLRSEIKLLGTYLGVGENDKDFKGRWLYSINPHGTDTGRDASKEHHFWCGQNVQNVPNERQEIKSTVVADEGYELWEADYSQAEARGVAYSSGDESLINAVECGKDFHSLNASGFFGIPYEEIYQDAVPEYIDNESGILVPATQGKTLNKPLRNLSKRVNHGTNYNMGEQVLLDTMGEKEVREAQKLLGLPKNFTLLQVTGHLLKTYDTTYPKVKGPYYNWIKRCIRLTRMLVGATGWTRYCFGDPFGNKLDFNSYIAHVTQSLNAMILDEAALRIFRWRLQEGLVNVVKVNAKIHDSILFQTPVGRRDLAEKIPEIMRFPVEITDCLGTTRTMIVPAELEYCGKRWEKYK